MAKENEKGMNNIELAELLRDVAAAYQILDEQKYRFQVIAYQRAADGIEKLSSEVRDYFDEGKLHEIPGVGRSLAEHLSELFTEGHSKHFEEMIGRLPKPVFELMKVAGIGPKKAYRLSVELKLPDKEPLKQLLKDAENNKIAELEGFGEESQRDIIQAINEYLVKPPERILIDTATEISETIKAWLLDVPGVKAVNGLGSLRRQASTVGDLDFSVAAEDSQAVFDKLLQFHGISRVIERGEHSCSIMLPGNIQVDVMVQPPEAYGSLLQHFTGSKHHNVALREYALKKGLSLSEYGVKDKGSDEIKKKFATEEEFYNYLGLDYIPPELREGGAELEAAREHKLPKLVELSDIKGDLQIHSDFDIETSHDVGSDSMESIIDKALLLDYEYIAFTEHNPSQKGHTEKNTIDLLERKREKIAILNEKLHKRVKDRTIHVFNSLEVDILPSGNLAISDNALDILDFALVSIHSSFKQDKAFSTKRILEALSHPNAKIFAHPTGRLLNKRESVDLNWEVIFDFALKNNKWIEINADPHRLDLPDVLVRDAVKKGVKLTLGTDSHSLSGMDNMKYGVSVARRGWATKSDIINTRTLKEFQELLR